MNLREEIEMILEEFYKAEIYVERQRKISKATDQILQVTNRGRLPCEHLTFKTQNGKIVELFIDNEEWKPTSPKYEKG